MSHKVGVERPPMTKTFDQVNAELGAYSRNLLESCDELSLLFGIGRDKKDSIQIESFAGLRDMQQGLAMLRTLARTLHAYAHQGSTSAQLMEEIEALFRKYDIGLEAPIMVGKETQVVG